VANFLPIIKNSSLWQPTHNKRLYTIPGKSLKRKIILKLA